MITWSVLPSPAAVSVELSKDHQYEYGITVHKGFSGKDECLSNILLCWPSSLFHQNNMTTLLSSWTTEQCLDHDKIPNVHVCSVTSLMANESLWVACAGQYNQSSLMIDTYENDTFEPSCPSYPKLDRSEHALIKMPIHDFDPNVFHVMVICGHLLWCVLDMVTCFAAQAKLEDMRWTKEYQVDPGKCLSCCIEQLFHSLLSDDNTMNEDNITTSYELTEKLSYWKEKSFVSAHSTFHPNSQFSGWFADTLVYECVTKLPLLMAIRKLFSRDPRPHFSCLCCDQQRKENWWVQIWEQPQKLSWHCWINPCQFMLWTWQMHPLRSK